MQNIAKHEIRNPDLLYPELSYLIVGACQDVWKELGPAFKESVYQEALIRELSTRQIAFVSQCRVPVLYKGERVGVYVPDFIIDDKILIEIKHVPFLTVKEKKQCWYYLKGTQYRLLLLINFGGKELEVARRIYDKARPHQSRITSQRVFA